MDYEYWLRLGRQTPFYYLEEKLAGSRLYADTKTMGERIPVHHEHLAMLREKFGVATERGGLGTAHVTAEERYPERAQGKRRFAYAAVLLGENWRNFRKYNRRLPPFKSIAAALLSPLTMRFYLRLLRT